MSMITPLLDTLLHEVLGRRMDVPAPRQMPEGVKPTSRSDALLAVRSDSRLNQQSPQVQENLAPRKGRGSVTTPAARQPPAQVGTTITKNGEAHLSVTARIIASLLARYSLEPAVLQVPRPLLAPPVPAGDVATVVSSPVEHTGMPATDAAKQIAEHLQGSIRESGLFYESHLRRWLRGEFSHERLRLEPQGRLSPADITSAQSHRQMPSPAPVVNEALQGIVHHQLELLASPVLRWEGDIWAGLFMTLIIQPPLLPEQRGGQQSSRNEQDTDGDEEAWRSSLTLNVKGLGQIGVNLALQEKAEEKQVMLVLQTVSADVKAQLNSKRERLLERLRACGFVDPGVSVALQGAEQDE